MKWSKLLQKLYGANIAHDAVKVEKLQKKALKKNIKAHAKKKKPTVAQVAVR
jgi:hypothetical protein